MSAALKGIIAAVLGEHWRAHVDIAGDDIRYVCECGAVEIVKGSGHSSTTTWSRAHQARAVLAAISEAGAVEWATEHVAQGSRTTRATRAPLLLAMLRCHHETPPHTRRIRRQRNPRSPLSTDSGLSRTHNQGGRMKKTVATLAIASLLALTGCGGGSAPEKQNQDPIYEQAVHLKDGRTVTCIIRGDGGQYRGGLSCDWAGAK